MDLTFEKKVRRAKIAQQRRLGGGVQRKRCRKGKSCGASCIASYKVCFVDVSDSISRDLGKFAREIISRSSGTERKRNIRKGLSDENIKAIGKTELNRAIQSFSDYIKANPANDNPANRNALVLMRALRAQGSPKPSGGAKEKVKVFHLTNGDINWSFRVDKANNRVTLIITDAKSGDFGGRSVSTLQEGRKDYKKIREMFDAKKGFTKLKQRTGFDIPRDQLLNRSPKYKTTPGESKPIPKANLADVKSRLEKDIAQLDRRLAAMDLRGADPNEKKSLNVHRQKLEIALQSANRGQILEPGLYYLYNLQKYNGRPEVVATKTDLMQSNNVLKNSDGSPIILYRGVTRDVYSDQFKGVGYEGSYHYPGRGIYGDGTYAASKADPGLPGNARVDDRGAIATAKAYAGGGFGGDKSYKITAFALRSDANVVQFKNMDEWDAWSKNIVKEASQATGYPFRDVGAAAAAMGIHAYRMPVDIGTDYWVVLNRRATIVSMDPELDKV